MSHGIKWKPIVLTPEESRLLSAIPKAVLFVVARQFAAQIAGECDNLAGRDEAIYQEWEAQYLAGNCPQKPKRRL